MKKPRITPQARAIAQWHRDKAIRHWLAGRWDEYARHIRIADRFARR